MRRRAVRTALAWGDTSRWYDYATRVLTISDGASALCLPTLDGTWDGVNAPWVFRAHAARFHVPLETIHTKVEAVDAVPSVEAVGRSSLRFRCDIIDPETGRRLASTRGAFVHVDEETHSRAVAIPERVAETMRGSIEQRRDGDGSNGWAALDAQVASREQGSEGGHRDELLVRATDADALGHVNNAKWALLIAEALASPSAPQSGVTTGAAEPAAISIDYVSQAAPGDRLAYHQWPGVDGCTHLAFHARGADGGEADLVTLATVLWPAAASSKL